MMHVRSWQVVRDASTRRTLTDIATHERCLPIQPGLGYVLGIDASAWLSSGTPIEEMVITRGPNPVLAAAFHRLAKILKAPVAALFVFEGNQLPEARRQKHAATHPDWAVEGLKSLIMAFGFCFHEVSCRWRRRIASLPPVRSSSSGTCDSPDPIQAPGEAVAELARLNELGLVDTVVSDDARSALLFGAETVTRNVDPYTPDRISTVAHVHLTDVIHNRVPLSRAALVLVALLTGGGTSEVCCVLNRDAIRACTDQIHVWLAFQGIDGFDIDVAFRLVRYNIAEELVQLAQGPDTDAHQDRVDRWVDRLRTLLCVDPSGHLGGNHEALATAVATAMGFPDLDAVRACYSPCTSEHPDLLAINCEWCLPDIDGLLQFCMEHFHWRAGAELAKNMHKTIWPGVCFRVLLAAPTGMNLGPLLPLSMAGLGAPAPSRPACNKERVRAFILKTDLDVRTSRLGPVMYRVECDISTFHARLCAAVGSRGPELVFLSQPCELVVPVQVLHDAYPGCVRGGMGPYLAPALEPQHNSVIDLTLDSDSE
ncbi:hypothetical protein EVG20_g11635 [Dentipellis fragilis]|uniref:XPG-I domain-containing protein n=1 Tax=Dentipellis fragilis TaxID=205917 RepID=A0A4Y9XJY0_9AGAM|nr:hypothetical protein EVG20_g11635 [Dentipellis fragilis]